MSRKSAFTLVELLVVIGIISVLIAILLPALNKARAAANTVACASNMRQIVTAMLMYASENKGALPAGVVTVSGAGWASNQYTWDDIIDRQLGLNRSDATLKSWRSDVDVPVLRCPADAYPIDPGMSLVARRRSYAMTGRYKLSDPGGMACRIVMNTDGSMPDNLGWVKVTQTRRPTETLLLVEVIHPENVIGSDLGTRELAYVPSNQAPIGGKPIHGGGKYYNYAFVDGHVSLMLPSDTLQGRTPGSYAGGMWTVDPNLTTMLP